MTIKNTLVLGNGFSRAIFADMPSWESLFKEVESAITNYTILYEVKLLKDERSNDEELKKHLLQEIENAYSIRKIKSNTIFDLDKFGEYLANNNIGDIITTNYDKGIELVLTEKCGYEQIQANGLIEEEIYSIRTYKKFVNNKTGHEIKLWKIHGDVDRVKSITLGFDHYCGSLSKLSEYIKGKYKSDKGPECSISIVEKCKQQTFDELSWAELFFNSNVYIVGFGMDFCEIDIWWLLNKHMRIKREVPQIQNNIFYLYNNKFDNREKKKDIFEALEAFQVEYRGIDSDQNYIQNIFREIKNEVQ